MQAWPSRALICRASFPSRLLLRAEGHHDALHGALFGGAPPAQRRRRREHQREHAYLPIVVVRPASVYAPERLVDLLLRGVVVEVDILRSDAVGRLGGAHRSRPATATPASSGNVLAITHSTADR